MCHMPRSNEEKKIKLKCGHDQFHDQVSSCIYMLIIYYVYFITVWEDNSKHTHVDLVTSSLACTVDELMWFFNFLFMKYNFKNCSFLSY